MRGDFADITVVVDRSGSMQSCRQEAENGVNEFVAGQKAGPGKASLTLVQFDNEYEFVHRALALADVPKFSLSPRGGTALLDAVGRSISETGSRLEAMPEADRPGLVIFVVVTDGHENASKEFTKVRVKEMVEHQRSKYGWQFTFLGANQDAFAEAGGIGIVADAALNYVGASSSEAFVAASANATRMRFASASGGPVCNTYTEDERLKAAGK